MKITISHTEVIDAIYAYMVDDNNLDVDKDSISVYALDEDPRQLIEIEVDMNKK